MYTDVNFRTKKALREAVADGRAIRVFAPGLEPQPPTNGDTSVMGPHYPAPHSWYARVTLVDGVIVKVK